MDGAVLSHQQCTNWKDGWMADALRVDHSDGGMQKAGHAIRSSGACIRACVQVRVCVWARVCARACICSLRHEVWYLAVCVDVCVNTCQNTDVILTASSSSSLPAPPGVGKWLLCCHPSEAQFND